jgi:hypothetical protein
MKALSLFTLIVTTGILLNMLGFLFIRYDNIVAFTPHLPGKLLRIATPIVIGILPGLLFISISAALSNNPDLGIQLLVVDLQYSAILGGLIGFLSALLSQPYIDANDRSMLTTSSLADHPWRRGLLGFIIGAVYGFVLSGLFGFSLADAIINASGAAPTAALVAVLWPIMTRQPLWRRKSFAVIPLLLRGAGIGLLLGSIFGLIEGLLYVSPTPGGMPTFWIVSLVRCGLRGFTGSGCALQDFSHYLSYAVTFFLTFMFLGTAVGLLWQAARIMVVFYRPDIRKRFSYAARHVIIGVLFGLVYALTIYTLIVDFSQRAAPGMYPLLWVPIFLLLASCGGLVGYARGMLLRRKKFPSPSAPSIFAARNSFLFYITVRATLREYLLWAVLNGVYTTAVVAAFSLTSTSSEAESINPLSVGLINAMVVAPIGTLIAGISYYCIWKAGRVDGRNAALIGITFTLLGFGLQLISPISQYIRILFS